jgi:hypothetical protein
MFQYNSIQTHSEFKNIGGKTKGVTKEQCVKVRGKTGYKSVTVRSKSGNIIKRSKKNLTRKEINCIKRCEFIPGLFKDCLKCLK